MKLKEFSNTMLWIRLLVSVALSYSSSFKKIFVLDLLLKFVQTTGKIDKYLNVLRNS